MESQGYDFFYDTDETINQGFEVSASNKYDDFTRALVYALTKELIYARKALNKIDKIAEKFHFNE